MLSSENVANPNAVHFAWMGNASECNLFNKEEFSAVPFITGEWRTVTKEEKYAFEIIKQDVK
jgi:sialate O-acetylesterase